MPIAIAATFATIALAFWFTAGPLLVLTTLFLSYVGGMALWPWLRIRGLPPGPEWVDRALAFQTDDHHRLRVIAGPREAFALAALDDAHFEPRIFTIHFALPPSRWAEWTIYFAVLTLWFGFCINAGAGSLGSGQDVIRAALVVGLFAAVALGCPTYLRLSPGRLDVMRFLILSKRPRTTTFDLTAARILIDFNLDVISIEPPGAPDAAQIEMHSVLNRVELARAILEAARARAPGPPLPDDALTG